MFLGDGNPNRQWHFCGGVCTKASVKQSTCFSILIFIFYIINYLPGNTVNHNWSSQLRSNKISHKRLIIIRVIKADTQKRN